MVQTLCNSLWAYPVQSKGAAEQWVIEQIAEDLETVGLANERIIIKAVQENSITDVQRAVVRLRKDYATCIEQSRVGDSNSNVKVEGRFRISKDSRERCHQFCQGRFEAE